MGDILGTNIYGQEEYFISTEVMGADTNSHRLAALYDGEEGDAEARTGQLEVFGQLIDPHTLDDHQRSVLFMLATADGENMDRMPEDYRQVAIDALVRYEAVRFEEATGETTAA